MAIATQKAPPDLVMTPPCRCTVRLRYVHPGEAQTWLTTGLYDRQRTLRPYHAAFLKHLMDTGRFRHGTPIDLAQCGEAVYVVNGQHTLTALVASQKPQWLTLTTHTVESMDDIAQLYSTFDRQMPRNAKDMLKAYGFPALATLNIREADMLLSSQRFILSGLVHGMPNADPRLAYLRDQELLYVSALEWTKEAQQFCAAIRTGSHVWAKVLLRLPLFAVGLVLFRYQADRAKEFWELCAQESHSNPRHVTRLFTRWVQRESLQKSFNRTEFLRMTAAAWDVYYHDRPVRSLMMQDPGRPINLPGTPHTSASVRRYLTPQWEVVSEPVPYAEPMYARG